MTREEKTEKVRQKAAEHKQRKARQHSEGAHASFKEPGSTMRTVIRRMRRPIGIVLILLGILLIGGSLVNNIAQRMAKDRAIAEFEKLRVISQNAVDDRKTAGENAAGTDEDEGGTDLDDGVICMLRIPDIDSEEPVKDGSSRGVLAAALGHMEGTAYPGEIGNCVIAGHRNYSFGKFFNRLDEVAVGDLIYIDTLDATYTYQVREIKVVEPDALEILDETENEQLTLFTCTPIYIATHRLVVIADRLTDG